MDKRKCVFCALPSSSLVIENQTMMAIYDKYPVTVGHCLIIPKEHRNDYFDLSKQEHVDLNDLLGKLKETLMSKDSSISGFNIGANCGEDAGQTVFHCHIHLIPRRSGDMPDPKGGVRGVIPDKQCY